ncbi:MAG TPA: spirocyclase AveC family protein [Acidimicrobiia bacterium]|nr:spirocyclase AveC family protein [Acidimicrobiia bacterium]
MTQPPPPRSGAQRRRSPTRPLAALGAVLVVVQAWTWGAWLRDGPAQVTRFQDPQDFTFKAARVMEAAAGVAFVAMAGWIVRRCVEERRLIFDAKLFLAGLSALWLDGWTNFVAPIWFYNSNFTNTPPPTAYLPGVINPVMKDMPFPTVFHLFNYPLACVGAGIVVSALLTRLRRRFPAWSTARLLGLCALFGMVFDVIYESFMIRTGLWAFPGTPDRLALWGSQAGKFPIFEIVPAGLAFAAFGALRFFRDDRGDHPTERGLGDERPGRRAVVSLLATVAVINLLWMAMCTIQVVAGFYASPYKPMQPALVAGICDGPLEGGGQRTGTRYGPCPQEGRPLPVRRIAAR